ncbi:Heavy metal transport/detoxification superfamily protein [Arabidopsis thaliana]|jgi:copper chaperone CopZ|uniref:Heavy metal-associated isoprenylated plant protein 5 n=2 Tax=Arabidopsis thaliana TaxID=3702 RepID=HIP5_ARATH|nr:Heavy metal transport/detoxification superfamily protein [Arabidopsis thaliana]Q9SJL2.2 RecName: Full=Heavy metal-associated isoprenylated plant protein 5; Short=AtHIP05; AltName: Full=Farnesylated protein 2; Short=AtFP2; Flags: Precursor [Arabidopsis thaliana]AAD31580.2 putative farnesylated protein [Arabidopsis thaliana]AEC09325.1 Heavy metal transport/detoxification superfamily protein [Arabidopsis thaliana]|eukprot:NP_565855.1 Heavy metal transport/detoxification superfamily protein [Arabidopsis thaliana]
MGEVQEGPKVEQEKKPAATVVPVETTDGKPKSGGGDSAAAAAPPVAAVVSAFVYKVDMHCEGCAKKIKRMVKHFDGVKDVTADTGGNKLLVVGKIDPVKLQEKLEEKTKRKVVLANPPPKVEGPVAAAVGEKKADGGDKEAAPPAPAPAAPKESVVPLKIRLHCEGCIQKIKKIILKIKGVETVAIDGAKDVVTVKGTIDVKELVPLLTKKLKRTVEPLVPAKKDDGAAENKKTEAAAPDAKKEAPSAGVNEAKKEGSDGGEKKKEVGDGGEKKKEGGDGGEKKKEAGDGGEKKKDGGGVPAPVAMVNKMDYYGYSAYPTAPMHWQEGHVYGQSYSMTGQNYPVGGQSYPGSGYNYASESYVPYAQPNVNAPGMFSDENPNGCSVM